MSRCRCAIVPRVLTIYLSTRRVVCCGRFDSCAPGETRLPGWIRSGAVLASTRLYPPRGEGAVKANVAWARRVQNGESTSSQ